ncbi:DUF327 family protein [Shouchella lehensis]|uniref:DUF327 family protein n=2 Tax=Shouchella lehensis TaxID=300825 RepID=A0A4Y7WJ12_9BACI|nr:hypothetical protein [Shouchella lehensis]TES48234.1 DUF327 family protein [Shouchella lehensis]
MNTPFYHSFKEKYIDCPKRIDLRTIGEKFMFELKHINKSTSSLPARHGQTKSNGSVSQKERFQEQLKQQSLSNLFEKIDHLKTQGMDLVNQRSYGALASFRRSLEDCLKHVLNDSYHVSVRTSHQFGQFKQHQLVHVVNQEMDLLTKELFDEQKTSMDLLKRVGKLEGILLEIYV